MLKENYKHLVNFLRTLDILTILISFYISVHLRDYSANLTFAALAGQYQIFLLSYMLVWPAVSKKFDLYASKRKIPFKYQLADISKSITVSMVIAAIIAYLLHEELLDRRFIIDIWALNNFILITVHYCLRRGLKYLRSQGYNYRQILIIGHNNRSLRIEKWIKDTPELGIRVVGYIDVKNERNNYSEISSKCIGELSNLEKILREKVVDEVVVCLPIKSFYSAIEDILKICEFVGVEVKIPTDIFSLKLAKSTISLYGDIFVIDLYTSPPMSWQLMVKRLMDIMISASLIVLLLPLFLVVSSMIKLTSKGQIFFKQERVGYNGRIFNCLKFRTMVENADELKKDLMTKNEMDGPVFKIRNDPRITRIGRILRKTSIDELPQLLNVLIGDMSLVGPRPPIPDEVNQYDLKDRRRLSMKPGITCIWQVSGRNSISFDKWMELDRKYIDEWSLWLDFKILLLTVPAVFRGSGAA